MITNLPFPNDTSCEILNSLLLRHLLYQTPLPPDKSPYYKLLKYSGSGLNDLGDYYSCKSLSFSSYYIISLSFGALSQSLGICVFKECTETYIAHSLQHIHSLINDTLSLSSLSLNTTTALTVINPDNTLHSLRTDFKVGSIISLSIILLLLSICCISTVFSIKALDVFNIKSNLTKIFTISSSYSHNKILNALRVFDGVRFISSLWVLFGHSFVFPILYGARNATEVPKLAKRISFSIITSAFYAVDVFFYISGFMLNYSLHKTLSSLTTYKNNNILLYKMKIIIICIIKRYIRLLPFYLFILFPITYVMPFITSGPNYYNVNMFNKGCLKNFWKNLLYVNNVCSGSSSNVYDKNILDSMCAMHCWYLACDMQFFVVCLSVLVLFSNVKYVKWGLLAGMFGGSCCWQVYSVVKNDYTYWKFTQVDGNMLRFFQEFYMRPEMRVCPYIMGIWFCELFINSELYITNTNNNNNNNDGNNNNNECLLSNDINNANSNNNNNLLLKINNKIKSNKYYTILLFTISLTFLNFSFWTSTIGNITSLSLYASAFYNTFNKLFFVTGISLLLHLTFLSTLPYLTSTLTHPITYPISRVSYGIYMLHIYFISLFCQSYNNFYYISILDLGILAIGIFIFSFITSTFIGIIIESPFIRLINKLK